MVEVNPALNTAVLITVSLLAVSESLFMVSICAQEKLALEPSVKTTCAPARTCIRALTFRVRESVRSESTTARAISVVVPSTKVIVAPGKARILPLPEIVRESVLKVSLAT